MKIDEVKDIYDKIESSLKNEKKACSKGCSACCSQMITVMSFEREAIKNYLQNELDDALKTEIRDNLNKWFDYFDTNTPDKDLLVRKEFRAFSQHILKHRLTCPFLINDICSIYEMRPTVCRTHYVEATPKLCAVFHRNAEPKGKAVKQELINSMKESVGLSIESLTHLAAEALELDRKIKRIEKIEL